MSYVIFSIVGVGLGLLVEGLPRDICHYEFFPVVG